MNFRLKNTNQTDEVLLKEFLDHSNQEAFGKLFSRYIPLVYGLCLKYLQHQQDAEDAVMHIYEELLDKVKKHEIGNFKNWLYSVSKNHCLQILRKNQPRFFEEISKEVVESDSFLHLLDESDDKEKENALQDCLKALPKEQRKCVHSFFFDECSYADIVLLTGYALNKVKSYIQNGKRNLKTCMVKTLQL